MRKVLLIVAALGTSLGAFIEWWRRHPRAGAGTVNRLVNPWLVRQGVAEASRGEIGLIEHIGRKSGVVRVTPIHPVRTADGFRIIVPLGGESHWARNVVAAGHCRVQVGETIHELDEPRLVAPSRVEGLPPVAAHVMGWLGFRYLVLRQFAEGPGRLEVTAAQGAEEPGFEEQRRVEPVTEPVAEAQAAEPEVVPTAG